MLGRSRPGPRVPHPGRLRAVWAVAVSDAHRSLNRVRFWVVVGILVALGMWSMLTDAAGYAVSGARYTSMLGAAHAAGVFALAPLAVPFALAGGFASDRASRYTALSLTRGMSRLQVVLAHLLGASLGCVAATALPMVVFIACAGWILPPGDTADAASIVAMAPHLLRSDPIAYLALVETLAWLACTCTCAFAVLVGAASTSALASEITPAAAILAAAIGLPRSVSWLGPLDRADFVGTWARWNVPVSQFSYWGGLTLLFSCGAWLVYRNREE